MRRSITAGRCPMNRSRTARPRRWGAVLAGALVLATGVAPSATAIQPRQWQHTTEADFEPGDRQATIITNLGDIKLAVGSEVLADMPEAATILYDLQEVGGRLYLAGGPEGRLLVRHGETVDEVTSLAEEQIFALDVLNDELLVAISGTSSRLAVLRDGKLVDLHTLEGVRYIWDVVVEGQTVFAATGTEGKLLQINLADPQAVRVTELLDAAQNNILCLDRDGQGQLYAGTDTDGLIYRVTLNAAGPATTFVIYDAPEPEIGAILVQRDGTVYAGTADAAQARPGRMDEASATQSGRPSQAAEAVMPEQPGPDEPPAVEPPEDIPNVPPEPEPMTPEPAAPEADPVVPPDALRFEDEASEEPKEPASPDAYAPEADGRGMSRTTAPPHAAHVDSHARRSLQSSAPPAAPASPAPAAESAQAESTMPPPASAPTPEQRDQLREVIRARLLQAREGGALQRGQTAGSSGPMARSGTASSAGRPSRPGQAARQGNAVYRIDPSGFVAEVFRESVMILRLLDDHGRLLVATGNEGQIFRVDPGAEETTILLDLDAQQIPAMVKITEGGRTSLLVATANPASLVRITGGFAQSGTYTSPVLDASQISLWGTLHLTADIPSGTKVAVQTRSGNVQNPEQAAWAEWSEPVTFSHDAALPPMVPREGSVTSPPARFLQYRLTLSGTPRATSVVDRVALAYVTPNLRPAITSIRGTFDRPATPGRPMPARGGSGGTPDSVAPANAEPVAPTELDVNWEAEDPNGDALRYKLEYRAAGASTWLQIVEDQDQTSYTWQTSRVPDGWYVLRVTASDAADNVPSMDKTAQRLSDPILVDNTPPTFERLRVEPLAGGIRASGLARDKHSIVAAVQYAIDSETTWRRVLPDDLIYDSTSEAWDVTIPDLSPGLHVLSLRVTDQRGNALYKAVEIEVSAAAPDEAVEPRQPADEVDQPKPQAPASRGTVGAKQP